MANPNMPFREKAYLEHASRQRMPVVMIPGNRKRETFGVKFTAKRREQRRKL